MTSGSTISVALSVYNSERYVREQLASILAQTLPPDEVIVGDDGSTDSTLAIIEQVANESRSSHPGVSWTILRSGHVGIAGNMRQIFAECTGDIVIICDHDDRCRPERFERLRGEFDARPSLLFLHSEAELIDSEGRNTGTRLTPTQLITADERQRYRESHAFDVLVRRNVVTGATGAFRRELLELAEPFPGSWVWDEWLGIVAASQAALDLCDEVLLDYRQHASNNSGVRGRGLAARAGLLRKPGRARNERQLARARTLVHKLDDLEPSIPMRYLDLAREKLRHESVRSHMPKNRVLRALPVLREAATGAYSRAGRGRKDILLDLVQPLD